MVGNATVVVADAVGARASSTSRAAV
ncbi:Protein of unknown function [Propionibacterium freudenreichii subsp. freudenreichii]|uniref:Uncharacterized protein n=1 Tax=Propionibacterium freudenreichii subsp. freudenreichii TaxID=66712 RepID=A0A0B7P0Z7_PROFF|nr:Protein of unknown function [Propionibacterium freudenreichii]CEP27128.1 Protein of unknown function [Propionibacterium freudenreichii subsp. freudenreichii]CEG96531.1 Protein of unknown function [Propionibacterium freudenreichii]CEH03033.1 Protein of unknown function [Propionibacterium freudenreichii]CEH06385.1 Protein of unknown function [Propionibacterium freudenreichii]